MASSEPFAVLIAIVGWAILFGITLHQIETRLRDTRPTASDRIFFAARRRNCSEFELFRRAGDRWSFSDAKIERDFKAYLLYDDVPEYVLQYLGSSESGAGISR